MPARSEMTKENESQLTATLENLAQVRTQIRAVKTMARQTTKAETEQVDSIASGFEARIREMTSSALARIGKKKGQGREKAADVERDSDVSDSESDDNLDGDDGFGAGELENESENEEAVSRRRD